MFLVVAYFCKIVKYFSSFVLQTVIGQVDENKDGFPIPIVAALVISVIIVLAVLLTFIGKCKVSPCTKTHDVNSAYVNLADSDSIQSFEKTSMSVNSQIKQMAPTATTKANGHRH